MKETITLAEWLAALRSGRYPQGQGCLLYKGRYCCLGVGVAETRGFDDAGVPHGGNSSALPYFRFLSDLPEEMWDFSGNICVSGGPVQRWVSDMNDGGRTFAQIADAVEARARELGWTTEGGAE